MRLSPLQRKDIAEKLLKWLKDNNVKTCVKTDEPLRRASEEIDEHLYDLWKAFDLLKIMGRVTLNNPNGRRGFLVLDYTPLAVYQLRTDGFKISVEEQMLTDILKTLKKRYSRIWDEALAQVKE